MFAADQHGLVSVVEFFVAGKGLPVAVDGGWPAHDGVA
jgi:hypothetical protein